MKKSKSKKRPATKKTTKPEVKKPQSGELLNDKQELFYYGPPPAIKALYLSDSGYNKDFHPQDFLVHLRNGRGPDEVAAGWGISRSKLNTWVEAYPEMAEARAVGATAYVAYWKGALRLSAFGQLKTVRENSLFKILDNQVGFSDGAGGHEFADTQGSELVFVDSDGNES